jgi:hypothetical protein
MLIVIGPLLFKISSKGDDASRHLILDQGDLACRNRRMIPRCRNSSIAKNPMTGIACCCACTVPALSGRAGRREFDLKDPLTISQSGCGASGESHHERAGRPCVRRKERRSLTPVNPLTGRVTAKGAPAYEAHSKSVELASGRQQAFVRTDEVIGCVDVIAPVDAVTFSRRAGELISRKKAPTGTPTAGKYRLRALQCFETAAQTRDPYAKDMLTVVAREFLQAARQAEDGEF